MKARTLSAIISLAFAFGAAAASTERWTTTVWRGETAYVRLTEGVASGIVPFAGRDMDGVKLSLLRFENVAFDKTEKATEVVKDRKGNVVKEKNGKDKMRSYQKFIAKESVPDVCKTWKPGDAQPPAMVKVSVAADAKPGVRKFGPFELTVLDRVLPEPKDWKYFLDLWQHPWAVSRFFNVEPFSKEHYAKMEPVWKTLADCGCKALTVTILDLPWNHQCYDGYHSMIERTKNAAGGWTFDYSTFDEYVAFGRKCGLGPDIACYSMCPWGYMMTWREECKMESGKCKVGKCVERREKILPGTPEFEEYWGPFLVDFAKHLKERGWFADAYIAMDERKPEDVKLISELIQKYAPGMKVAMAGNKSPSEFEDITIDNYCQGLIHLRKHPKFFDELEPRRQKGYKTTFYVCASAMKPNTFMDSPLDEGYWLGAYPAITGFDGFLRWAANSWPKNPYEDASYRPRDWRAGDTFFVYPNGELSARLIALRSGVVAAEKLRILRDGGCGMRDGVEKDVADIASKYDYKTAIYGKLDFAAFRREVESLVNGERGMGNGEFRAVSPDGLNEIRLESTPRGLVYSVRRRGKTVVEPTGFSMSVKDHGWLNGIGAKPKTTSRRIDGKLPTPIYKKSKIDLAANETRVDFGDWAVVLHARNDGVAWRFETKFDGEIVVPAENTNIRFPKATELCYTVAGGFMSGWEKPAKIGSVESVPAGHPQIVMTPFTATIPGAGVVTVTESNLRDYPGLNFYRRENEPDTLRSWQAGAPKEVESHRRKIKVASREPYLAKTSGTRVFPWRVFVLGDTPSDLVASDAVYALAEPSRVADASWVKPGQVAWDWWNGFLITDVPGLKTGCNFETYKEYVNFAAANGIAYIIMDEGWAEKLDPEKMLGEVNVPGVIAYAREKGVGVILWAAWAPLTDREKRLRVFDRCATMGAKGFKIDFIERDDQVAEKFLEETAADAAERKLVVMYHGIHKPTGLQRTYPNILNYEGVYGLEQGGSIGGRKVVISNDVNLVYTRMVAGFMDYTPGAMRNRAFDAPPYDKERDPRSCYGTRCHQLALFPMFEAPIQMLCDSPTQYRTEPECTAFLTKVPTVWDETCGVAGEINKFASVARRKGRDWWLGAITNWDPREFELSTKFLGEGEWKVEAFEDAADADVNAEHYVRREFTVKAGDCIKVRLAPGGGFAARFTPASKASASICEGVESMKVMTYNIRYSAGDANSPDNNWEARRDDLGNLVESANPDVAGFQEVLPDQRKWLEARFPGYAFVGDGRNADRVNGEASPIAFRKDRFEPVKSGTFWLSETPDEPGSKGWNAALPRICSYAVLKDRATGRTFAFANTHTDHKSEKAREMGMLLVIERMKEFSGDAPVVFVGDHNCLEYEKPAKAVAKLLKDALYISETPPEGSWRTFNYWSYKEKEQTIAEALAKPVRERSASGDKSDSKRIDYIYVSPGTRVIDYRTIATPRPGTHLYPSDHFPTVATIQFK